MKKLFFLLMLLMSFIASANDQAQKAEDLFTNRDRDAAGIARARDAANIYASIANSEGNVFLKAEYLIRAGEAIYFFADNSADNKVKIDNFLKGAEYALAGAALLERKPGEVSLPKDQTQNQRLARAYYWYGVNKARWAEANGVLNSLSEWPTIKKYMLFIINDLKEPQTQFYGANRILGKAYMKLPFPLGSNKESLKYLSESFDKTVENDPDGISVYGVNCLYYAEILAATGDKEYAIAILETLISKGESDASLESYNPTRKPESRKEIEEAAVILKSIRK